MIVNSWGKDHYFSQNLLQFNCVAEMSQIQFFQESVTANILPFRQLYGPRPGLLQFNFYEFELDPFPNYIVMLTFKFYLLISEDCTLNH